MNNGDANVAQEPQGNKPLLPIGESIIFKRESRTFKDTRDVEKI